MNVLVACEESQEVCKAFRDMGHRAFSCDIQECSGGHPEWHVQGDVLPLLNGDCFFTTADTHTHTQRGPWDLIIAHPPCTYLTMVATKFTISSPPFSITSNRLLGQQALMKPGFMTSGTPVRYWLYRQVQTSNRFRICWVTTVPRLQWMSTATFPNP